VVLRRVTKLLVKSILVSHVYYQASMIKHTFENRQCKAIS